LAIECPATQMPAILVVNATDTHDRGRFQLLVSLPGGRTTKTRSMAQLEDLCFTSRDAGVSKDELWQSRCPAKGPPSRPR
jgi:hypothetical protein